MFYRFLLLSDEIENFERVIEISPDATFSDFRKAILQSVGFTDSDLTTFYICSDDWQKNQEILFMEMDTDSSSDLYLMEETKLDDFIEDEGQRLMFVFDLLTERAFFIELKDIVVGKNCGKPSCVSKKGNPPKQAIMFDETSENIFKKDSFQSSLDTDFYGNDMYNEDEFDADSFSDLNFD